MRVLVTGGSGSGKSAFAEQVAASLSTRRTYLATMSPNGAEAQSRIARHRSQRADLGFVTIECAHGLPEPSHQHIDARGVVLLDDLGNLVANALFTDSGQMEDPSQVLTLLERQLLGLAAHVRHMVVVGNEVGCEGASPYETTQTWVRLMGSLCCRLAARFDCVVEVNATIPLIVKGNLP